MQVMDDLRYALRQLRKSPGFTLTAVLTLGLGLGATATMLSVVERVLLAPLPYPDPARLVGVAFTFPQEKPNSEQAGTSADFVAQHSHSFSSLGVTENGVGGVNLSYSGGDTTHSIQIAEKRVSQGYLATLGVQPALGRNFSAEEDRHNGPKAVLLSDRLWASAFHRDPAILNRTIRLNEDAYTVVGVLPASFRIAARSLSGAATTPDVWAALQLGPDDPGYDGDNYDMIGRLAPGVTLARAEGELGALGRPFYRQYPKYESWINDAKSTHEFRAWPLEQVLASDVRTSLLTLLGAVLAVLLVACLNLAGLATSRAVGRTRELALRAALGASRGSLLRLLLAESVLLALAGGVLGLGLARVAIPVLVAASPIAIPMVGAAMSFWLLAAVVLGLAFVTTLVFGLVPALAVFRSVFAQASLSAGHTAGASRAQARLGQGLIVAQVAFAMLLLSAASLLLGSFLKLRAVPSGVDPSHLVVAQVTLKGERYASSAHTTQFVERALDGLAHTPGVRQVAAISGLPLDRGLNMGARPVADSDQASHNRSVEVRVATPSYFSTAGVTLLQGRDLAPDDRAGSPPVAVISEMAAKRWWPGRAAIGEQVRIGNETNYRVVGIVSDTRNNSLAEPPQVMVYVPFAQLSDAMTKIINGWISTTLVVRLGADVDMAAAVQGAIVAADPEIPVARLSTMQGVIDQSLEAPRFFSWLSGGFAGFALLLTVVGLFGLLSYQVTARTREIGVRMALGADRVRILTGIVRSGLTLSLVGLALGAAGSFLVRRAVASVLADSLYTGDDPISTVLVSSTYTLAAAGLAILVAAMLASFVPARRAASTNPMQALRSE